MVATSHFLHERCIIVRTTGAERGAALPRRVTTTTRTYTQQLTTTMARMERPPIYTVDDDDLAYLNPGMTPEHPHRYRSANRLRTTEFVAKTITGGWKRGRQRAQRSAKLFLRNPCPLHPVRHYYSQVAQNVMGNKHARSAKRYEPLRICTPIDQFLIATLPATGDERLLIPLEVLESYVFTNENVSSLDDLLLDLLKDDETADRHRERLQKMMECEPIVYVASPPRPPRLHRPPPPTPPPPPPTPPPTPMRRVFPSESGHGCMLPSPVRKAPIQEEQIIR